MWHTHSTTIKCYDLKAERLEFVCRLPYPNPNPSLTPETQPPNAYVDFDSPILATTRPVILSDLTQTSQSVTWYHLNHILVTPPVSDQ